MAVETYGGDSSAGYSWGTGVTRAYVWAEVWAKNDDVCYVRVRGAVQSVDPNYMSGYGVRVQVGNNGSNQWNENVGVINYGDLVGWCDVTYEVGRIAGDRTITVWTKYWGETVDGNGGCSNSGELYMNVTVPARVYHAAGTPTIATSKNSVTMNEAVNITWAKSSTQGNANFDHFVVTDGMGTTLYSGTGTYLVSTPSSILDKYGKDAYYNSTSAPNKQKGYVYYAVQEVHEWYGSYPASSWAWIGVEVKSGIVTIYDSSGKKHTGLVTVYDSNGTPHFTLISAYDASGNKHETQ